MGKFKIILYASKQLKDKSNPLMLRITSDNNRKYIGTGLRCKPEHWNDEDQLPNDNYTSRSYDGKMSKADLITELESIKKRARQVDKDFEDNKVSWNVFEFASEYEKQMRKTSAPMTVLRYADQVVYRLRNSRKTGNAETYAQAKRALDKFLDGKDITFGDLTTSKLIKFKEFYEGRGCKKGTISVYLRTIRAIYNRAIVDGYAFKEKYPFTNKLIPKSETNKRALLERELKAIKKVALEDPELERARDYYLFSFYTRGMNFHDLSKLKLENIQNEIIIYERAKTGVTFKIKILPQLRPIINKYVKGKLENEYLFPVLNPDFTAEYSQYNRIKKVRNRVNGYLRIIAKKAEIPVKNLTFYSARHSFATIMLYKGASIAHIKESLGHKDSETTEGYLKSFGDPVIDEIIEKKLSKV